MINIRLTENRLEVKGHAGYAEIGKDIVCAAVSVLVFTFLEVNKDKVELDTFNNDEIAADLKGADTEYLTTGLEFVENEYPGYVQLNIDT